MTPASRIRLGFLALAVIIVIGAAGYVIIADATIVDALYLVIITVTTVGFAEVVELDTAGRIWTLAIIIAGVGTALYTVGAALSIFSCWAVAEDWYG